jgi:hypothetical protein
MAAQPFERLLAGDRPLLQAVESVVVDGHRRWYARDGRTGWSEPAAYHWLRYEDPDPVSRLAEGVRRLPVGYDEAEVAGLERLAAGLGRPPASARRGG